MAQAQRRPLFHELFPRKQSSVISGRRARVDLLESRAYLTASFSGPVNIPGVALPASIAVADFTGGMPGVVVDGYSPSATSVPVAAVFLQVAGVFATPTLYPFNGTASGVATGDFQDDGHQDIAVIDSSSNTLDDYIGDGQGDFSPGAGASLGGSAGDTVMASADFNGDGEADLAVVDPVDNQVAVFFSSSASSIGTFTAAGTISVPSPIGVVAANFNSDNHPDLAVLSSNGSVYIAINNGAGNFGAPVAYSLGMAGADPASIAVADLTSGGLPDLAIVGSAASGDLASAIVLPNNGDGTFGAAAVVGAVPVNPISILSGNFTGSGHTDLAVLDGEGGLTVIPGNGDGTFGLPQTIFTNQLRVGTTAVAADFNGDGLTDIAYLNSASGGFSELINTSNGTSPVTPSPIVPTLPSPVPATTFAAGQTVKPFKELVKLTNSGKTLIKGKVSVTLTLSQTTTGSSGDPVVATYPAKTLVLKPNKIVTIPLLIRSIPAGLDGSYFVRATVVDPSMDTNAAWSAAGIRIVPPTIDLTGSFVSSPVTAVAGKAVSLGFSITNLGSISAIGPLTVDLDTSDTAGMDSSTTRFDVVTIKRINLKPGGITRVRIRKVLTAAESSPFYFVAVVDPNDAYNDAGFGNNLFSSGAIAAS